jgi:hypothetical protein
MIIFYNVTQGGNAEALTSGDNSACFKNDVHLAATPGRKAVAFFVSLPL